MAYESGDTIRALATFREWAAEGTTGAAVDPSSVVVKTFDADGRDLATYTYGTDDEVGKVAVHATRDVPYYFFDWVLPTEPGNYTVEFKGMIDGYPALIRQRVKVKFDVRD